MSAAVASPRLPQSWLAAIGDAFEHAELARLKQFLLAERKQHTVYPAGKDMFRAFWLTEFHDVKVVILGQDPYHGPGQAHGLSFSVRRGTTPPPSLQNIFKEIDADIGIKQPRHGDLTAWAKQGVLLLNTVLSVRARAANSHRGRGWEHLTDRVIAELNRQRQSIVFVLWGAAAGRKATMIDGSKHVILRAPHPSPLSAHRGFFGCQHFSKINKHLVQRDLEPIEWQLPE